MLNINFVPDDYIQNKESRRTNLMYLILLAAVMAAIGGSFMAIKIRRRSVSIEERIVNTKMVQAQEAIRQLEQLRTKRKSMMKTALTTAELLEAVPRSVLLASLTNNLPQGMSLLRLKLVQKQPKRSAMPAATSKYHAAQAQKAAATQEHISAEKLLETSIDIEGVAPSDIQVASYIKRLSNSMLLENVALVESKEHKLTSRKSDSYQQENQVTFRQFKLKAMLKKDAQLTKEDIKEIASVEYKTGQF